MTTEEQIEHWLATSPARTETTKTAGLWPEDQPQRRVHGEASVSVGTGGYSSAHVATVIPVGENGWLGLSYSQTDFGDNPGYGWGYHPYGRYGGPRWHTGGGQRQSFGVRLDLSDTRPAQRDCGPGFRSGLYDDPAEPGATASRRSAGGICDASQD